MFRFWDITPCSPLKVNLRFGGIYSLHLQGRRIAAQETSVKAGGKQSAYFPPKRRLTFNGLQGVISQKIVHFMTTVVRTSNATCFASFEECYFLVRVHQHVGRIYCLHLQSRNVAKQATCSSSRSGVFRSSW
jgi:hypothetical protein